MPNRVRRCCRSARLFNSRDIGYEDLVAETSNNGRRYTAPDGNKYPSVTTVLGILNEEAIAVRMGENRLLKDIDIAITKLQDSYEIRKYYNQYFGDEYDFMGIL